jgi:glycosyltransferase involved in cell wall biosynthesis
MKGNSTDLRRQSPDDVAVTPHPLLSRLAPYEESMQTAFSLTVIVPVYNERHLVRASLSRLLSIVDPLIREMEIIVVDDHSTDGSAAVVCEIASENPRVRLIRHETNLGKGAAIRTGLSHASSDITLIHDADLEYHPGDIPSLLIPFSTEGADAVYGSRYISAPYRRVLMHRHTVINRTLTSLSNWLTDLNLTDVETCYKAINTSLLKSIPIRSNDFCFEVEITAKLAKRRARVFEVPIRYLPRTEKEGKKIRPVDGFRAVLAMLRFWAVDDLYKADEYGSHILVDLERARRFTSWMADVLRPHLGDRVLEIGAGIGTLTNQFIPRDLYLASDINPHYLAYLRSSSFGKPYMRVRKIDAADSRDFSELHGVFDTVLLINVLEHVEDPDAALRNIGFALQEGGRVVVLVPQHPRLFGTLDQVLEHKMRYTKESLRDALDRNGFEVEEIFDFNRLAVPGWYLNGKMLKRRRFSRLQLKFLDMILPVMKRLDRLWPWSGLSLIAVGRSRGH